MEIKDTEIKDTEINSSMEINSSKDSAQVNPQSN
jgi:hypothetical protein